MIESVPSMAPTSPPETRGVEHPYTPAFGGPGQLPGEEGRGGAHVDDEGAFSGPFQQAIVTGDDLLYLRRPGEHGDDDVAPLGDLLRRVGDRRPVTRKPFGLGPGAVVDHEFVARPQEILRHGRPHDPEAHEPHLLHRAASLRLDLSAV
jgi:hypothetical protein